MGTSLLVCEDDPAISRALDMKLSRAGYEVHVAPNGQAGWTMFQSLSPALMITDFQMPVMDGLQLIRHVRGTEQGAGMPIILLTAKLYELDDFDFGDDLRLGEVLVKPFSPREVVQIVERLLGESHRATSPSANQNESKSN